MKFFRRRRCCHQPAPSHQQLYVLAIPVSATYAYGGQEIAPPALPPPPPPLPPPPPPPVRYLPSYPAPAAIQPAPPPAAAVYRTPPAPVYAVPAPAPAPIQVVPATGGYPTAPYPSKRFMLNNARFVNMNAFKKSIIAEA